MTSCFNDCFSNPTPCPAASFPFFWVLGFHARCLALTFSSRFVLQRSWCGGADAFPGSGHATVLSVSRCLQSGVVVTAFAKEKVKASERVGVAPFPQGVWTAGLRPQELRRKQWWWWRRQSKPEREGQNKVSPSLSPPKLWSSRSGAGSHIVGNRWEERHENPRWGVVSKASF